MKHNPKITAILLGMFIVTQLIGMYVVSYYAPVKVVDKQVTEVSSPPSLPLGLETPRVEKESQYSGLFIGIVVAFIFAILLFLLLTRFKVEFILKLWFFIVVVIALSISFLSIFSLFINKALVVSVLFAFILAIIKIYGRNFIVHNATELFIYPGIAAVFVPILNVWTIVALLILISIYDAWAVWHSGIMQRMAKYQINQLKIFSGFFVPYFAKGVRQKIKNWKKTLSKSQLRKKKIKVSIAILGGGDVVFPIITAGVMLKTLGITSAIFVIIGATLGLAYLFFFSKKRKFYPAMPFITAGILLGILVSYLVL